MPDQRYASRPDHGDQSSMPNEGALLTLELQDRLARLNDQARIFIPLIALCLIFAIPIWSKSLTRFLKLLLSPFVLLPLAFCIIHLVMAWRGIIKARSRIRAFEAENGVQLK